MKCMLVTFMIKKQINQSFVAGIVRSVLLVKGTPASEGKITSSATSFLSDAWGRNMNPWKHASMEILSSFES